MEDKIKEIQRYFIDKIIKGEFEIKNHSLYLWKIEVEEKPFVFWISNGKESFRQYNEFNEVNFIQLDLTEEERNLIYEKHIQGKEEENYIKNRRELYEELKREFE